MHKLKQLPVKFILFSTTILLLIFIVENINHRFWLNDFRVYYSAAQAMISGSQVYGTLFALGSGYYKYSPFTGLLIMPLSFFSYPVAAVLQYTLLSLAIIGVFILCWQLISTHIFNSELRNRDLLISVAFICVINHLVRELHLGNINVVLLLLLCLSLACMLKQKTLLAGIFLAIVVITKPFFVLLFLPLLLHRELKTIFSAAMSLILFVLNPAILTGITKNIQLHREWIHTMLEHNASFPSNNTFQSLVKMYVYQDVPESFQYFAMLAVCLLYVTLFLIVKSRLKKQKNQVDHKRSGFVIEWFLFIAVMPLLFRTDTQHFLLSLPLVMVLLYHVSMTKKHMLILSFVVVMLMYGGNSSDLLGKNLSNRMDEAGILGISNVILIGWVIFFYFKSIKKLKLNFHQ